MPLTPGVDDDATDPAADEDEEDDDALVDVVLVVLELGSFLGDFLRLSPVEAALEFELSESDEYLRLVSACGPGPPPLEETVVALQLVLVVLLVEGVLIVALEVHLVDS